jgi:PilZ domain-containing protein
MPSGELAERQQRTRRSSPRARVSWTAWARAGHQRMRFHTVDISPRGAKLRPKGPYRLGTALRLEFTTSSVVWRADADGMAVLFLGTIPKGFDALGHRS